MLDICLLGTGGMMPLPHRWLSSLLLRYQGRMILIDCGEGTQIPLVMQRWGLKSIDAILLTHYHADHIAGLPGLLLTIGNAGREEPLLIAGPPGLGEILHGLTVITPELPFSLQVIELSDCEQSKISVGDITVKGLPLEHTLPCLAYCMEIERKPKFAADKAKELHVPKRDWKRLQNGEEIEVAGRLITPEMVTGQPRKGIKVCYCTDTRPKAEIRSFANSADLFICEGMYGEDESINKAIDKRHMTFSEAASLAKQAQVKELWLTHYSPSLAEPEQFIDYARAIFQSTITARDLQTKTITFEEE